MSAPSKILGIVLVFSAIVQAQATGPSTDLAIPEGPLQITITGIEGIVQARPAPDEPWKRATLGMVLSEGAEFRTGTRSAVRFTIPPDQTVSLDRLGTVQVLRSNFQNGKIITDLGMKYGRTRYDIEAAGREHEATVRSPSSVLAVRGTQVSLQDEPPFAPQATSLTGRAQFRDARKQIAFGGRGQGKTKVAEDTDTPAGYALNDSTVDPRGQFSGRTVSDNLIQLSLNAHGTGDFSNLGVLALLDQARSGQFTGTVIGSLFIEQQVRFFIDWPGASLADVDLTVISPSKEIVSFTNPQSPSGGFHLGNAVANAGEPLATETVLWPITVPPGKYIMQIDFKSGQTPVTVRATADDPLSSAPDSGGQFPNRIDFKSTTVSPTKPTVSIPVTVKAKPPVDPTNQRIARPR